MNEDNKLLAEQIKSSYIHMYDNLKKEGKVKDYSINYTETSEDEIVFNVNVIPVMVAKNIKINITVTKDGVDFEDEKDG